jgi:ABC-type multidrug transport system permease subunit
MASLRDSPLFALTMARLREFVREPGAVFWTFGFPLLITVALGIAFRDQGPPKQTVAVIEGPRAADLVAALRADPQLVVELLPADVAAARLRSAAVLLTVDGGPNAAAAVVYRFDPGRPDARGARQAVDDRLQRQAGRHDTLVTRDETAVARGARYVDWMVPGLLGMQLLSGALWGTAWTIVNARQRRLLKRLAATPMRRRHFLLSFRLAGLLFVPLQVVVLFLFARLTFGVRIQGSLAAVFALSLYGSWSFAGLGLLCAARAQNSETANGLVNLVTLPMFVLCGVFFSSSRFPSFVQPLIQFLPLSAFNEALRHVVNDGASLTSQGGPLLVLLVWGVASATVALRLFRWT